MSNFCGPKSGCKTNRCICKLENLKCKAKCNKCKCNSDNCTNVNDSSDEDEKPLKSIQKIKTSKIKNVSSDEDDSIEISCSCAKDKCRNNRCICVKNNIACGSHCNCNDCENKNKQKSVLELNETKCKCLSGCSTNHCICKKNKNFCIDCNCNKCVNQPNRMELDQDVNEIASKLSELLRIGVADKRDDVFHFRNDIDIYTLKTKNEVENPQVDHIIEDQMVGHAAARILRSLSESTPYMNGLKKALNVESLENYNVTFGRINGSKGSIIKQYLKDGINNGLPLRIMVKPESHFGKNIEPIFQAMNDTHLIVEEYISEAKRSDNNISGSKFKEIADELNQIVREMKLDINDERSLRSNKKY